MTSTLAASSAMAAAAAHSTTSPPPPPPPPPRHPKPAPIARAESAPPTRGTEAFEKPVPLPKAAPAGSAPHCRPPTNPARHKASGPPPRAVNKSTTNTSGALKRPKRMLPRDPMALRCSLAMSRTESVLVSSSGDVMVCRCRRSSTPYLLGSEGRGYISDIAMMDPWANLIPCCDTDFIVNGPWSPVFDSLTVQKKRSSESATSESSLYEWEKVDTKLPLIKAPETPETKRKVLASALTNSPTLPSSGMVDAATSAAAPRTPTTERGIVRESAPSPAASSPYYQPPTKETLMDFNAYDGEILPLPSFDYDHIHNGQNDMLSGLENGNSMLSPKKSLGQPQQTPSSSSSGTPGALNNRRKNGKVSTFPTILEYPEEKKDEAHSPKGFPLQEDVHQPFYHGIPIFLTSLSQIRISKVSSHPLGAHVLMISEEALLFSYGLNNHGQLGIGVRTNVKDETRGFITTPTLITPLLENGGKAINCAAGVDHSLVVVVTEGRRLHRLQTKPGVAYSDHGAAYHKDNHHNTANDEDSVRHHQLYGFGSNDYMKIGLVRARLADDGSEGDGEDILLPRRVALHCTVWPQKDDDDDALDNTISSHFKEEGSLPPQGIFDIAASKEHSAALVRRATGDIEVYMWGNATLGALGLPVSKDPHVEHPDGGSVPRRTSNANNIFPLPTVLEGLSFRPQRADSPLGFPRQVALGSHSSFVVMSSGRCMSFGFSAEGMLGHGLGSTHTMDVKEIVFPPEVAGENGIVSINVGAYHVIALSAKGDAYSWGINLDDRLGHGTSDFVKIASNPDNPAAVPATSNTSGKEDLFVVEWMPQKIDLSRSAGTGSRGGDAVHCVVACAGYDSSMLVTRSGEVYSFGKRSGRLGKGEVGHDVRVPEPLHAGLRLFHNRKVEKPGDVSISSAGRTKPLLKRIQSDGAFNTK